MFRDHHPDTADDLVTTAKVPTIEMRLLNCRVSFVWPSKPKREREREKWIRLCHESVRNCCLLPRAVRPPKLLAHLFLHFRNFPRVDRLCRYESWFCEQSLTRRLVPEVSRAQQSVCNLPAFAYLKSFLRTHFLQLVHLPFSREVPGLVRYLRVKSALT